MGIRGEIFSTRVLLENRTYFFNVKENRLGDMYLNIVESKNRETGGGFDRQSVILFAEDLPEFLGGFEEALRILEKADREKRRSAGARSPARTEGEGSADREARPYRRKTSGQEDERPRNRRDEGSPRSYGEGRAQDRRDESSPRNYGERKIQGRRDETPRSYGEARAQGRRGENPRSYGEEKPRSRGDEKPSRGKRTVRVRASREN